MKYEKPNGLLMIVVNKMRESLYLIRHRGEHIQTKLIILNDLSSV